MFRIQNVIVTNPTHYAVALKYDDKKHPSISEGAGVLAQRIKEIGEEHRILQLEAPPLARALYRHAEIAKAFLLHYMRQLQKFSMGLPVAPLAPRR